MTADRHARPDGRRRPMTVTIGKLGDPNGLTQLRRFAPTSITKDGSGRQPDRGRGGRKRLHHRDHDTGFTRRIYQIPVVGAQSERLIALNNQTYQVSPNSGSFFLWDAGDGPTGAIVGYAREGSTTDVAAELTALIQTHLAPERQGHPDGRRHAAGNHQHQALRQDDPVTPYFLRPHKRPDRPDRARRADGFSERGECTDPGHGRRRCRFRPCRWEATVRACG